MSIYKLYGVDTIQYAVVDMIANTVLDRLRKELDTLMRQTGEVRAIQNYTKRMLMQALRPMEVRGTSELTGFLKIHPDIRLGERSSIHSRA